MADVQVESRCRLGNQPLKVRQSLGRERESEKGPTADGHRRNIGTADPSNSRNRNGVARVPAFPADAHRGPDGLIVHWGVAVQKGLGR
jgi:hypothetical protein